MPLITGPRAATPMGIQENIQRLLEEGKTQEEAVAIAYRLAEEARKKGK
jgi:hypothetical protein